MASDSRTAFEVLGVIGVITSLVFVGYQLKQTNEIARIEAQTAMGTVWQEANLAVATDERLSALIARVQFEDARMTDFRPEERLALAWTYVGLDHFWEQTFKQLQVGVLEEGDISFLPGDDLFFSSDFHRDLWPSIRSGFSDEFARFWEERFDLETPSP